MILDTSALVAILYREPEAADFVRLIHEADTSRISVANYVELSMVIENQMGAEGMRQAEAFFRRAGIVIEPVTVEQGEAARQAFLDFGKGRLKAGLNYGDCFAYALAKTTGEQLLFKGQDFGRTDIPPAAHSDRGARTARYQDETPQTRAAPVPFGDEAPTGELIRSEVDEDHRYRITRNERGYLITARQRDRVGLIMPAEWLHRTAEAANACLDAVIAYNAVWNAFITAPPTQALERRFEEANNRHKQLCVDLKDEPLIGEQVRALRDTIADE